jgi:hypothetical protein
VRFHQLWLLIFLQLWGLPLLVGWAHPFHTSVAEMDWNPQSRCWEVSLRMDANDLETALQNRGKLGISLESQAAIAEIQAYLAENFGLQTPASRSDQASSSIGSAEPLGDETSTNGQEAVQEAVQEATIQWVGHETQGGWVWLYFELAGAAPDQPLAIRNSLLVELNEQQLNLCSIRIGKMRLSVQTSAKQWIAELKIAPPK